MQHVQHQLKRRYEAKSNSIKFNGRHNRATAIRSPPTKTLDRSLRVHAMVRRLLLEIVDIPNRHPGGKILKQLCKCGLINMKPRNLWAVHRN